MDAIVMAAGKGRRLRPVTERWPKPILPVDGRPVVATVLRELRGAGCDRVTVVTGHLAQQVEALLGDGSAFGLELRYARQARPDGSADAVSHGLAAGAEPPLLVVTADTVFRRCDLARFAAAFAEAGNLREYARGSGLPGTRAVRDRRESGPRLAQRAVSRRRRRKSAMKFPCSQRCFQAFTASHSTSTGANAAT